MADNKGTHSQQPHTRQEFSEVKGKTVDIVELVAESDYYGISIRFQDQTALTFSIEPCLFTSPVYTDWKNGEETVLKKYQPLRFPGT